MIYPKKNTLIHWFFDSYVKRMVKQHFHGLSFNPIPVDPNKSILLIANHFSYWDGLILYCINEQLLKKKLYIMVLEETMQKEPFLKYAGAFSVSKNSREIITSINYAASLLNDPKNLVIIYPQGKLYSNFVEQVEFEGGIMRIIEQARSKFQLVFAATFAENFQHKKPTAYTYLKQADENVQSLQQLQADYQQHYAVAKQQQTQNVI